MHLLVESWKAQATAVSPRGGTHGSCQEGTGLAPRVPGGHTFWGEGTACSFQIRVVLLQHKLALGLISQTPDALSGGSIER